MLRRLCAALLHSCTGRKTDALKVWTMLRFRGLDGIAARVDRSAELVAALAAKVRQRPGFVLACKPWAFNCNFYWLPRKARALLRASGMATDGSTEAARGFALPAEVGAELRHVAVRLKLAMHKAGDILIPFQPIKIQQAGPPWALWAGKLWHHLPFAISRSDVAGSRGRPTLFASSLPETRAASPPLTSTICSTRSNATAISSRAVARAT